MAQRQSRQTADRTPIAIQRRAVLSLAAHLRELRAAKGWNQETTAASASLSFRLYQRLESTAADADLKLSTLARLASAFGVEMVDLLRPVEAPPKRPPGRPPKTISQRARGR